MPRRKHQGTDAQTIRHDLARHLLGLAYDYRSLNNGAALLARVTFDELAAMPPATLRRIADSIEGLLRDRGGCPWDPTACRLLAGDPVEVSALVMPMPVLEAIGASPAKPGPAPRFRLTADTITEV